MFESKPCPNCRANGEQTLLAFNAHYCAVCGYVTPTGWIMKATNPGTIVCGLILLWMIVSAFRG